MARVLSMADVVAELPPVGLATMLKVEHVPTRHLVPGGQGAAPVAQGTVFLRTVEREVVFLS